MSQRAMNPILALILAGRASGQQYLMTCGYWRIRLRLFQQTSKRPRVSRKSSEKEKSITS
jgi:hypothetical protein